jgi:hypothetical protein
MKTENLSKLGILVAALAVSAMSSKAYAWTCTETVGGEELRVVVNPSGTSYSSTVTVNGSSLPQLGPCFVMDRPSTRFVKCAHGRGDVRVEIYPEVETVSGLLKRMQYVVWNNNQPVSGEFATCND